MGKCQNECPWDCWLMTTMILTCFSHTNLHEWWGRRWHIMPYFRQMYFHGRKWKGCGWLACDACNLVDKMLIKFDLIIDEIENYSYFALHSWLWSYLQYKISFPWFKMSAGLGRLVFSRPSEFKSTPQYEQISIKDEFFTYMYCGLRKAYLLSMWVARPLSDFWYSVFRLTVTVMSGTTVLLILWLRLFLLVLH